MVKFAIVAGAFYFLITQLKNSQLSLFQFKNQLSLIISTFPWQLFGIILLTDLNWLLEILKWKNLVSTEKKITFFEAYEQCLASFTASIITPNRIGEYGAKALFYEGNKRKKIVLLNFIGNMSQLAATIIFGGLGMLNFIKKFKVKIPAININPTWIFVLITVTLLLVFLKKPLIKKYQKIISYLKLISKKNYQKTLAFSLLRFLIFSHQFYALLYLFGVQGDYFTIINLIFFTYLAASLIPGLSLFDWVIKTSVAVFIFGFIQADSIIIMYVTTLMWLLNFAVPALIGSFFVINFRLTADS